MTDSEIVHARAPWTIILKNRSLKQANFIPHFMNDIRSLKRNHARSLTCAFSLLRQQKNFDIRPILIL